MKTCEFFLGLITFVRLSIISKGTRFKGFEEHFIDETLEGLKQRSPIFVGIGPKKRKIWVRNQYVRRRFQESSSDKGNSSLSES